LQQCNKIFLAKSFHIQKLLTIFLMGLFAFAITPKLTLHNLVANHKDGRTKTSLPDASTTQLSKASFNCQCDNPVTESPFLADSQTPDSSKPVFFQDILNIYTVSQYSAVHFCFGLRGPPLA
jgi:hypothetical protein